jgi:hypothetical protein
MITALALAFAIVSSGLILPVEGFQVTKPNKQLTAKWWEWALSIPPNINPLADPTGDNCDVDQKGPVWYLAGTTGGSAVRECTIPEGKSILFPIINVFCSDVADGIVSSITSPSQLKPGLIACARGFMDLVDLDSLKVTIDGEDLTGLENTRLQSPVFKVVYPNPNVFGIQTTEDPQKSVADGFWILLKGLEPGEHTLAFSAEIPSLGFGVDLTYDLTIVPK